MSTAATKVWAAAEMPATTKVPAATEMTATAAAEMRCSAASTAAAPAASRGRVSDGRQGSR
jgi:hypothetical protein